MKILVINAGSTTLKYQLIDSETEQVLAKGLCERIFLDGQIKFDHPRTGEKILIKEDMPDHGTALKIVIRELLDPEHGSLSSLDEIDAVGHRIVQRDLLRLGPGHGGGTEADRGSKRSGTSAQSCKSSRYPRLHGADARRSECCGI